MKPSRVLESVFRAVRDLLRKKGQMIMLNVGDPAPDFTVKTHRGETVSLSTQRGKSIVLWFYPKADTPG